MKIAMMTLGCKVNQYESDSLAQTLAGRGHDITTKLEPADLYILSTCAVTNEAERKSRQMLAKISKISPDARIFVCGCASQNNSANFQGKPNVALVIGSSGKQWLADMLDQQGCFILDPPYDFEEMDTPKKNRTRSYLKIQDGCNNFCAYCLIPFIRGRSRSRGLENIVVEAFSLAKVSKEIVLTGINISAWGQDIDMSLISLVESLSNINARIRFSSMEMNIITPEFLQALRAMPNFCPHFHLSMQSGCDATLSDMNRKYSSAEYLEKVRMIRQAFPDAAVTTDLIVGFPGESDENWTQTLQTIIQANFAEMHIFPYSKRQGTVAAKREQVAPEVIKKRINEVTALAAQLHQNFLEKQLGTVHEVLCEQEVDSFRVGHSANYSKVYVKGEDCKPDEFVVVKIIEKFRDGLLGTKI